MDPRACSEREGSLLRDAPRRPLQSPLRSPGSSAGSSFLRWTRSGERRGNANHEPREVRPGSSLRVHFLGSTARPPIGLLLGLPTTTIPSSPERLGSHDPPTPALFRLQALAGQGQQPGITLGRVSGAFKTPFVWVAYADRAKDSNPASCERDRSSTNTSAYKRHACSASGGFARTTDLG